MTQDEIRNSLDDNNRELLKDIEKTNDVHFVLDTTNQNYGCQLQNDNVSKPFFYIFIKLPISQPSIYHELCHALIKVVFKNENGRNMTTIGKQHHFYQAMISNAPTVNAGWMGISNSCEHIMMYNKYINAGYYPEDFTEDNLNSYLFTTLPKLTGIKMISNEKDLREYLQYVISIVLDPRQPPLKDSVEGELKRISKELYDIVTNLRNNMNKISLCNTDAKKVSSAYLSFAKAFNKYLNNNFK